MRIRSSAARMGRDVRLALAGLACLLAGVAGAAGEPADLVFLGGAVYTVDAARSWAKALAVRGDRIVYVGTDAGAKLLVGKHTRVVDLTGRMLLPGFQDSHAHPNVVPNPETRVVLDGLATREAIFEQIRRFAQAHPGHRWIVGGGWDEAAFLPSGRPDRTMLDAIVPDRPVFLTNNSQHQGWVNSAALAAANITAATPDPTNGTVVRNAAGEPTGSLQETAMDLVRNIIPPPDTTEHAADLLAALHLMSRNGITTVMDAAVRPADAEAYAYLARRGPLPVRARLCQLLDPSATDDEAQLRRFAIVRARFAGTDLTADCVKIVLDGAYGSHTVALLEPYTDDKDRYGRGQLFVEPERLGRLVRRLDAEGFQIHVHAIGDRTVRTALDAIESARRANGWKDTRHTLAHLSLVDDADVPRFRRLGVIANMTPLWSHGDPWETVFARRMFGEERASQIYKTRTLLDSGAVLVWGSDWPVTGVSPLDGLETAITHRYLGGRDPSGAEDKVWNPGQRLSLGQAIAAYTASSAYLVHEEDRRGTLQVGKLADLVVLNRNLFETAPDRIHEVAVDATVLGGRILFERNTRSTAAQGAGHPAGRME